MFCVEEQTRLSIKNILLATMFSEPSELILSYAVDLARLYGSTMSLTGAVSPAAICEITRNRQADLVVIGTDVQELRKSDLDLVAGEILRNVPCPVLIIGPRVAHVKLGKGDLEQIVYVTDFTTSSLDGLPYALAFAQDHDSRLTFVHVSEEITAAHFHFGNSRSTAFRKRLESLAAAENGFSHESAGKGFLRESEFVISEGDRAGELVRIAANLCASLIVMSAGGSPAQMAWPLASQVVGLAHCPVLAVPRPSMEGLSKDV
jgi:nucleotide-binding universal stress UspA family protein